MSYKRPRRPRPRLLSLTELARRRGVDSRTIRRWIRGGCPVARRGKPGHVAPRFDEARVSAWLRKSEPEERRMVNALIAVTDARARRERNAYVRLAKQHIRPAAVTAAWGAFVAHVRGTTLAWLEALPARLRAIPVESEQAQAASPAYRYLAPAELLAMLAAPAGTHPWPAPAVPALRRFAEAGRGIVMFPDGGWHEEDEAIYPRVPRPAPRPPASAAVTAAVRELLTTLAQSGDAIVAATPAQPADPPPPPVTRSATLRAARAQLADHQARLVALRDAIATGDVMRYDDAARAWHGAVHACRAGFLVLPHHLGQHGILRAETRAEEAALLCAARPVVTEALENLGRRLADGGLLAPVGDVPPDSKPRRPRAAGRRTPP